MTPRLRRQAGAGLVETIVALPTLLLLVTSVWQAALVYRAKSNVNYAAMEAARAGSVGQARESDIRLAFHRALIPYYGGGRTAGEIADTLTRVAADADPAALRVEILSPTQESFTDYASPALQTKYGTGEPVIPNVGLDRLTCPRDNAACASDPARNASGQTLLDANLLKLRITYGIPRDKQVPIAGRLYVWALNAMRGGDGDPFKQALLEAGRIPIVTAATVRMQSDAIRNPLMASLPGPGNNGDPRDPGPPPGDPPTLPNCGVVDVACTDPDVGPGSGGGGSGGGGGGGACTAQTLIENGSADVLFDFDSATINAAGQRMLDQLVAQMRGRTFDRLTLTGFTDQLGDDAHNQRLSERRANAVRDYLLAHGLGGRDIRAEGRGEADPIVQLSACPAGPNQISCLAPNRRVVFTFEGLH